MLNRGGFANPDVLLLERPARPDLIVKDYGQRYALVRWLLAPWLLRHERAMLERVRGLPGVPVPAQRLTLLSLAMERIDGAPLARSSHYASLPPAFFSALEGILDGLADRGLCYLDLSSPSNILATSSGAPALVDLASAFPFRLPTWLERAVRRRALAKLRRRFERREGQPLPSLRRGPEQLDLGGVRLRVREGGPLADPVPILCLHDVGQTGAVFTPWLARAELLGRRLLAPDLPGFGGSRAARRTPTPQRVACWLARFLRVSRVARVDLVGIGWGGLVAGRLTACWPGQVRALATFDTPVERLEGELLERWRLAREDPAALRQRLAAAQAPGLSEEQRDEMALALRASPDAWLRRVYAALPVKIDARGPLLAARPPGGLDGAEYGGWAQCAAAPERLFRELARAG